MSACRIGRVAGRDAVHVTRGRTHAAPRCDAEIPLRATNLLLPNLDRIDFR